MISSIGKNLAAAIIQNSNWLIDYLPTWEPTFVPHIAPFFPFFDLPRNVFGHQPSPHLEALETTNETPDIRTGRPYWNEFSRESLFGWSFLDCCSQRRSTETTEWPRGTSLPRCRSQSCDSTGRRLLPYPPCSSLSLGWRRALRE